MRAKKILMGLRSLGVLGERRKGEKEGDCRGKSYLPHTNGKSYREHKWKKLPRTQMEKVTANKNGKSYHEHKWKKLPRTQMEKVTTNLRHTNDELVIPRTAPACS